MNLPITALFLLPPAYLAYSIIIYLRTGVPYVATPRKRLAAILSAVKISRDSVVYDLGCGKGDFLFAAQKYHPKKLVGYELSPLHVFYAQIKALLLGSKIKIYRQDFLTADISDADIIYLFLVQQAVETVWPKIRREAKPGTKIVVLSNAIPSIVPIRVVAPEGNHSGSRIYVYQL